MRILSLSQPWLWAVLHPVHRKWIENRTWAPPIALIGEDIALHAAKSWDDSAVGYFLKLGIDDFPARKELYERGTICGVVNIDRVRTCTEDERPTGIAPDQQRWAFGPYCWVLANPRVLTTPIPHVGGQGLRHLPAEITAAIKAQLA